MPRLPTMSTSGSIKPLAPCGYTPAHVRGFSGLDKLTQNGSGQTVAFVGANASPTLQQDVAIYSKLHGLAAPKITELVAPGVYRHPDTHQQVPGDFYGERTLDAEAIYTTAPGAQLLFVASSNANQDFDASINHIVDRQLSHIISISYGFAGEGVPQGYVNSLNNTFIQAVATGIGVYVLSGDNGDETTPARRSTKTVGSATSRSAGRPAGTSCPVANSSAPAPASRTTGHWPAPCPARSSAAVAAV